MLKLKDFEKVLVSYLKEDDKVVAVVNHKMDGPAAELVTIQGARRGVVVAIAPGIIGWSLCNKKGHYDKNFNYHEPDVFDKAVGIDLALKRAKIAEGLNPMARSAFYSKIPFSLDELSDEMFLRSHKYFGEKEITE